MFHLLASLILQTGAQHRILEVEHARAEDVSVLAAAMKGSDLALQRLAVRAVGRMERASLKDLVVPLLASPSAVVRIEAVNALAQMNAGYAFASLIATERDAGVRAAIFESIGRVTPPADGSESVLVAGLTERDPTARTGAMRGLESYIRKNVRRVPPVAATLAAIRTAFRDNAGAEFRELALLALNSARDRDSATIALARRDTSAQVRRLAVIASQQWLDDPSPMVRFEAMRVAGTCDRAAAHVTDVSEMVAVGAIDALGNRRCDAATIIPHIRNTRTWRVRAHALVALAKVAPDSVRAYIAPFLTDAAWQSRVYAATAAKLAKDSATLRTLARDREPNVAIEAMTSVDDAVRALGSDHAGLLLAAARRLRGAAELPQLIPQILASIERLTRDGRATMRDPRVQLLERVREAGDSAAMQRLRPLLSDIDPIVAALAADIITKKTGVQTQARTTRYAPAPLPSEQTIRALVGATAVIRMKGLGAITLELLTDEATVTAATFAQLAERGQFNGLTFHRVEPNFVIQGGSPGADEYDGITREFLRDELGMTSHRRGTLGISTRGRDTGDGQLFVNLVDNFRLDHDYTVFARVVSGMDIVDRVLEGDVIESITIRRRN